MGVPLRGIAAREFAHEDSFVGGRINAIHHVFPIYKTVTHGQVEVVFPSFGGVINAKVVVEMGVAELFAIEREQILATVVALLVTGVKTEAASGYSPERCRELSVTFAFTDKGVKVQITNSIGKGIINTPGGGQLIIENYMKKFSVKDFASGVSQEKSCFEVSFTLPF